MAGPLLETKLHLPTRHGRLVERARLSRQVGRASEATLTLVSAPAGFGKTTLMAELAERSDGARVAWLSLDPDDNDPLTFWAYVSEAVERAAPGVGAAARSILEGQGSVDAAVTALLNGLAAVEANVVLVLDDFHVIESPAIHEQVGYLLDHLPARGHVVIGTRADPAIPLARLRARGGLVEIRAGDLRFTAEEATSYLEAMGLALSGDNVATLEARTEGWIAALQLAALSLQGRSDATDFIAAFAGDDRYIVDYLVEEVLRRQPPATREFLLKTSILPRFTGPLADAVTAGTGGLTMIEALDRANLFVVPLDDRRRWYRYHHLFGGVLQAYLASEMPAEVPLLHRRASDWFEQNGDRPEAVEHALRAGDHGRAADLIELATPELRRLRRDPTLRRWMEQIPPAVVARRPVLAVAHAGAILSDNVLDGVVELLDLAEGQIGSPGERVAPAGTIVVDRAEFERLPAAIELFRAAVAKMRGDLDANIAHARRVLDLVAADDHIGRGGAAAFLGLAHWGMGDLEAGYRWYDEGMAELAEAGHVADLVGGAIVRADIRLAEGRLGDALRIYEEGLARATGVRPPYRGVTDMHTGLAAIAYQRNQLADARAQLEAGRRFGAELAFPRDPSRSRVIEARLAQADGDIDGAVALLDEAERLYLSEYSPDVQPIAALRARMQIAHGRLADAGAWRGRSTVTTDDPPSYLREFEHLTLARLVVAEATGPAEASLVAAIALLDRLLAAAEAGRRDGSRLEILVVLALARHAAADRPGAFAALDAAIGLARADGYVRVFLDEGPAMTRLLQDAARQADPSPVVRELLRAASGSAPPRPPASQGLVEPLSERELEVLRLLRGELDGPELARELVVSLNTLRTHTKNIYAKLGVGSRRAAVRRAEELGLL